MEGNTENNCQNPLIMFVSSFDLSDLSVDYDGLSGGMRWGLSNEASHLKLHWKYIDQLILIVFCCLLCFSENKLSLRFLQHVNVNITAQYFLLFVMLTVLALCVPCCVTTSYQLLGCAGWLTSQCSAQSVQWCCSAQDGRRSVRNISTQPKLYIICTNVHYVIHI